MRRFYKTTFNPAYLDIMLLILRVAIGSFMLVHGIPKLMKLFGDDPIKFADPIGIGEFPSLLLTIFAEVLCSVFILIGFWTRAAVIPLIITMAVAAFIIHSGDPFGDREASLQYLLVYLMLLVTGAGKYSVDAMMEKRK